MALDASLLCDVVTMEDGDRLHVLATIQGSAPPPESEAVHRRVVALIDVSCSVGLESMVKVMSAVGTAVGHLRPTDQIGIVTFDDTGRILEPLQSKEDFMKGVDALLASEGDADDQPGSGWGDHPMDGGHHAHEPSSSGPGDTARGGGGDLLHGGSDLRSGYLCALMELRRFVDDPGTAVEQHLIVFSDGRITAGPDDPALFASLAAGAAEQGIRTSCCQIGGIPPMGGRIRRSQLGEPAGPRGAHEPVKGTDTGPAAARGRAGRPGGQLGWRSAETELLMGMATAGGGEYGRATTAAAMSRLLEDTLQLRQEPVAVALSVLVVPAEGVRSVEVDEHAGTSHTVDVGVMVDFGHVMAGEQIYLPMSLHLEDTGDTQAAAAGQQSSDVANWVGAGRRSAAQVVVRWADPVTYSERVQSYSVDITGVPSRETVLGPDEPPKRT